MAQGTAVRLSAVQRLWLVVSECRGEVACSLSTRLVKPSVVAGAVRKPDIAVVAEVARQALTAALTRSRPDTFAVEPRPSILNAALARKMSPEPRNCVAERQQQEV